MNILAIDTSTVNCSCALLSKGIIIGLSKVAPRLHAQLLLPMIDELLQQADVKKEDLTALAFTAGPGSFTGLRIAMSTIQGLAVGLSLPVIPVSTLQTLAQSVYRRTGAESVITLLDARMHEVYYGAYQLGEQDLMLPVIADEVCAPGSIILSLDGPWVAVGSGLSEYPDQFNPSLLKALTHQYPNDYPDAHDVATIAGIAYTQNQAKPIDEVDLIYLRNKVTG